MFRRIALLTFSTVGVSFAQMTTFQPNTIAKASEVNANFTFLQNQITSLSARCDSISLLRTKIDSLEKKDAPVGSIIASFIEPSSDGYLPNSNQTWILAAGQKGISGFDSVPDLRGVFLRGIDYSVTGRNLTARDVERKAGSYQEDAFLAHSHRIAASQGTSVAQLNDPGATGFAGWSNSFMGYTYGENSRIPDKLLIEKSGSTETRSKNIAVYYYIKVK
jgi:hypothetical protein